MTTLAAPPAPQGVPSTSAALDTRAARVDAAVRTSAVAALWLSLLVVTYWWVAGGGVQDLAGWETGLLSSGRLVGLVGSDLLLAQVLLMARLPWLERAFGQDRLARLHRVVGFVSFDLVLAHVGLIVWGYAAGDLLATPATAWDLTVDYPGMLLALAGLVCLVMVVLTSIRAARSRLRHESWHLLHLYAYLGVGLALPHQLWTGQELLASTAATVYWWSAWAAAAGAVVVWRVALPLWRSWRLDLRVTSVVAEGDAAVSVYLTGRLDRLRVEAGQFLLWRFLTGPGWSRAHPYSLSAAPDGRSLRLTVKALGDGSAAVASLRPGTRVLVEGPFGRLTARARTRRGVLLVGSGVGITPLRALAEGLDQTPGDVVVLHRYAREPLLGAELAVLARERGLRLVGLPGPRRAPGSWLGDGVPPVDDTTALLRLVPDVAERDVFVCGPDGWSDSVLASLRAAGAHPDHVHLETFRW
ncbi:MAG: ferric reductase-like transmembrane domain-containing protein [Nocardioides sp.]|nr:ferric reductase-like transmembrane domain-containing protein [Nocardioides sp.]